MSSVVTKSSKKGQETSKLKNVQFRKGIQGLSGLSPENKSRAVSKACP